MIRSTCAHCGRVVVLVAAVAAVLVVGSVVVTAVLKSSDSRPAVPAGAAAQAAGRTHLRFQPVPGTKRTVRLVTTATTSMEGDQAKNGITTIESFVFDLEAMEPGQDGTAAIDVSLASIHVTLITPGQVSVVYDSTEPPVKGDEYARSCSPFIANRFTVRVSPRGEVIDPGLDGLFLAAAEKRAKDEDDALLKELNEKSNQALKQEFEELPPSAADQFREMVKKTNDQLIESVNARSGSRENRVLALKEQMEKSPVLGREPVSSLVNRLTAVLPDGAVRVGDTWKGSLTPQVDALPPISGMYTLQAVEQSVCTIQALGQRDLNEDPVVEEEPQMKVTTRLEGSSEATLQIERQTGWLLHREQKTTLHGAVTTTIVGPQSRDISDHVSAEITSTLTTLK